jgi:hypothetical protein
MPFQIGVKTATAAASITFVVCTAAGYALLEIGPWGLVTLGALFAAMTFGALMLAATAVRARSSAFWGFWTSGRVRAYNAAMGAVLIAVGTWIEFALDASRSTGVAIVVVVVGFLMVTVSLVEHLRARKRGPEE